MPPPPTSPRKIALRLAGLLLAAGVAAAPLAPAPAAARTGNAGRAEVEAALQARATPSQAARILRRLDRAFREARSGRGDLLPALLDVPAVPEGRRRLLAGPSPAALSAAAANALAWTGTPDAAGELLSRLFEIEREDGRLLVETFAPREPDGSLSLPGAR